MKYHFIQEGISIVLYHPQRRSDHPGRHHRCPAHEYPRGGQHPVPLAGGPQILAGQKPDYFSLCSPADPGELSLPGKTLPYAHPRLRSHIGIYRFGAYPHLADAGAGQQSEDLRHVSFSFPVHPSLYSGESHPVRRAPGGKSGRKSHVLRSRRPPRHQRAAGEGACL